MDIRLHNNVEEKQYETVVENHLSRVEYILSNGKIYLTHTEVPKELGGKGVGSRLVKGVMQDIEKLKLKLIPLCPFVVSYIDRHPEWKHLL